MLAKAIFFTNDNNNNINIETVVPKESVRELITRRGAFLELLGNRLSVDYTNRRFPRLEKMEISLYPHTHINRAVQIDYFMKKIVFKLMEFDLRNLYVFDGSFRFLTDYLWSTANNNTASTRKMNIDYWYSSGLFNELSSTHLRLKKIRSTSSTTTIYISVGAPISLDVNEAIVLVQQNSIIFLQVFCNSLSCREHYLDPPLTTRRRKFEQLSQGSLDQCPELVSFEV